MTSYCISYTSPTSAPLATTEVNALFCDLKKGRVCRVRLMTVIWHPGVGARQCNLKKSHHNFQILNEADKRSRAMTREARLP